MWKGSWWQLQSLFKTYQELILPNVGSNLPNLWDLWVHCPQSSQRSGSRILPSPQFMLNPADVSVVSHMFKFISLISGSNHLMQPILVCPFLHPQEKILIQRWSLHYIYIFMCIYIYAHIISSVLLFCWPTLRSFWSVDTQEHCFCWWNLCLIT